MRRLSIVLIVGLIAACHSTPVAKGPSKTPPVPGQTTFDTPLGPNGASQSFNGGLSAGASNVNGVAGGTTPTSSSVAGSSTPPSITESDIYKLDTTNNLLYVVNHYRGLQVIDISNPSQPALIGQAPIYSWPSEMYVDGTNVYVLDSDYYYFWEGDGGLDGSYGSRVHVFDVSTPSAPTELSAVQVPGYITDSRIVGSVLYLIATRYSWWDNPMSGDDTSETVLESVDVSNPANVQIVDTKEFPQPEVSWNQQIMATPYTVYVADPGYDYNSGLYTTNIQYVDISDESGNMKLRGSITVPGLVQDRWSMDEYNSTLRVASSQDWSVGSGYLTTWDVTNPDQITSLASQTVNTGSGITTARFDGTNGYLVSQNGTNPLYDFDLTNPSQPVLMGQPAMNGYIEYLSPNGTQMLSLGYVETTDINGNTSYALQVSLFNTQAGQSAQLLSQVQVGADWGWVPSSTDDYAKVFQVLTDQGLILMPFQSWDGPNYTYVGGVQLIDFNTTALTLKGLIQNAGDVERGVPDGNLVFTISDDTFQIVDITDQSNPQLLGKLELARTVQDFAPLDDNWAVQLSGDWYMGDTSVVVTPLMNPDAPTPTSELHIPAPYGRLFDNGNMAYVAGVLPWNGQTNPVTVVRTVDLTNRAAPTVRGSVALPTTVYPGYGYWYWGYGDEVAQMNGSTLAFHQFNWGWYVCDGCPGYGNGYQPTPDSIYVVDASNPDNPAVASTIQLTDASWSWGMQAIGNTLYVPQYRAFYWNGEYFARYSLNRFDLSVLTQPRSLGEVNVPGQFISANGNTVYTVEQRWDDTSSNYQTYLHALQLSGNTATELSSVQLPGYVNNIIVSGNTAYTSTWQYQDSNGNWTSWEEFVTIDLTNPSALRTLSTTDLPTEYSTAQGVVYAYPWLQSVQGGKALFGAYPGIITYDVTDPSHPKYDNFYRTQGWSNELILKGSNLFVPSGEYGVQIVDLASQ